MRTGNIDENYRVFTSGLLALNRALEETPGIGCEFAYPWVNTLLQGLPLAEFDRLAETAVGEELRAPLRRRALVDPRRRWRYDWTSGIRLYPEMKDLAACWQERGGEVVVSTASNRRLVEKTIAMTGFPCRQVIGMELAIAGDRFGRALSPGLRPNLGAGQGRQYLAPARQRAGAGRRRQQQRLRDADLVPRHPPAPGHRPPCRGKDRPAWSDGPKEEKAASWPRRSTRDWANSKPTASAPDPEGGGPSFFGPLVFLFSLA